jgi:CheY-like chemotaxis protein
MLAHLHVNTAYSGEGAIDSARRHHPDLVLMDTMMPVLDGPSTLLRIRETPGITDIPIIFLTARVMPAEVAKMLSLGAIGVIAKPFDPVTLGRDISAIWQQRHSVQPVTIEPARRSGGGPPVDPLAHAFLERSQRDVERLRDMVSRLRTGDYSILPDAERLAHTIHGTAGMLGYLEVSAWGGAIERLVERTIAKAAARRLRDCSAALLQLEDHTGRLAQSITAAINSLPSCNAPFHWSGARGEAAIDPCNEEPVRGISK